MSSRLYRGSKGSSHALPSVVPCKGASLRSSGRLLARCTATTMAATCSTGTRSYHGESWSKPHSHRFTSVASTTWSSNDLSTDKPQAISSFDDAVVQYVGWYGDPVASVEQAIAADPDFVMGHIFKAGLHLFSTGEPHGSDAIQGSVAKARASKTGPQTERERMHLEAVEAWANGESLGEAARIWNLILDRYPRDELALKFANDAHFFLGESKGIRDSVQKVLPSWSNTSEMPLYGYALGMWSFGLEEMHQYDKAEKAGQEALQINRNDPWAVHALAHVYEMRGQSEHGIRFLESTKKDWAWCTALGCHLWWHLALYHVEHGRFDEAIHLYDDRISKMATSGSMLDLVDVASLLQRLTMEGVDVGKRWEEILPLWEPHVEDHLLAFNDVHLAMTAGGAHRKDISSHLLNSLHNWVNNNNSINNNPQRTNFKVTSQVGIPLCKAFLHYHDGHFRAVMESFLPILEATDLQKVNDKSNILLIGGSHAQRDVFWQLLLRSIAAALKEERQPHQHQQKDLGRREGERELMERMERVAVQLLAARKAARPNSLVTKRLEAAFRA
ncbi:Tetratricopeptide repeat protein 38 [Balamuthia mandrillaris]